MQLTNLLRVLRLKANAMLGTTTSNFADVLPEELTGSRRTSNDGSDFTSFANSNGKWRQRSKMEQQWQNRVGSRVGRSMSSTTDAASAVGATPTSSADNAPRGWLSRAQSMGSASAKSPHENDTLAGASLGRPCIVELLGATNVPAMVQGAATSGSASTEGSSSETFAGGTNPFMTMAVVPGKSSVKRVGKERRWPFKSDTCCPIWHKVRDLGKMRDGDMLRVALHHHNDDTAAPTIARPRMLAFRGSKPLPLSQLLGRANLPLAGIELNKVHTLVLQPVKGAKTGPPITVTLRFIPPRQARKTVFIVRHAER